MTRKTLALLIWLVSTVSEGALHWTVQTWLDADRFQDSAGSEPIRRAPDMVSQPTKPEPAPAPTPVPIPTPAPPPLQGWDLVSAGSVDLFVLTQEKRWKLKKAEVVDANGQEVEDMESELRRLAPQVQLDYGGLIAVGTASCEGLSAFESRRAENRADMLVDWLRKVFPDDRKIYRLNLGRFKDCSGLSPQDTASQRRVIVLAIRNRNDGLDLGALGDKLRQDLSTHRPLGFDPADYSEFTLFLAR